MASARPLQVLVAGGGIATLELLLALRAAAGPAVAVTVLSPAAELVHRPEAVGEPFGRVPRRYDLAEIVAGLGGRLRPGALRSVDPDAREVVLADGHRLGYETLVVAVGTRTAQAVPGATSFRPGGTGDTADVVREIEDGRASRVAFVAPAGAWALPAYELALHTAGRVHEAGVRTPGAVSLVTAEPAPLAVLRGAASDAVARRLEAAGVVVYAGREVTTWTDGTLTLGPDATTVPADRVVALPVPTGPGVEGLPMRAGFVRVDERFAVPGAPGVFAIGDAADYPVKQGGLATQEADVVASTLARQAGADVPERPFRARVRAVLWTGAAALYLSADLDDGEPVASDAAERAPWWPPEKVAGAHLAPFLLDVDEVGVERAVARADERRAHPATGALLATPDREGILPLDREA
ncbi:FAD-dependent oxidoreductase [Patulibacter americanus]|uniref:FAD-dependent oxidoreductase n=1 Tax=Patulibacter americanus TaxID=588672 RepID=UPI0003B6C65F|nr:FAD-dependent oxidoreductase [Patulibacter americanus]